MAVESVAEAVDWIPMAIPSTPLAFAKVPSATPAVLANVAAPTATPTWLAVENTPKAVDPFALAFAFAPKAAAKSAELADEPTAVPN